MSVRRMNLSNHVSTDGLVARSVESFFRPHRFYSTMSDCGFAWALRSGGYNHVTEIIWSRLKRHGQL